MKLGLLAIGLVLAGCGSSTTTSTTTGTTGAVQLPKSTLSGMPVTQAMPTGTANFQGKAEFSRTNAGGTERIVGDLNLAANFSAATVQATGTNIVSTFVSTGNTSVATTSGSLSGAGTINGSAFIVPSMTGNLTITGQTNSNGSPPVAGTIGTAAAYSVGSTSANFVGPGATGLYGSGTTPVTSGGTAPNFQYEIYGTKQ